MLPSDYNSSIIRSIRKLYNLTQTEFGEVVGVHQVSVARWEAGRTKPSPSMWKRVLRMGTRATDTPWITDRGYAEAIEQLRQFIILLHVSQGSTIELNPDRVKKLREAILILDLDGKIERGEI